MPKKLSEAARKEAISKKAINIFCRQTGCRWGATFLADHEVLTLIESYFEAWERVENEQYLRGLQGRNEKTAIEERPEKEPPIPEFNC